MGKFEPEELAVNAAPIVVQDGNADVTRSWRPLFRHDCSFPRAIFTSVMLNLIKNPNLNSSWLFRADILHDADGSQSGTVPPGLPDSTPGSPIFRGFELRRRIIRKLIPRNTLRDQPLDQTCLIYESCAPADEDGHDAGHDSNDDGVERTLVVYLPHISSQVEMPFYHPQVRGIVFLHEWTVAESHGSISISYLFFSDSDRSVVKLTRTALQLLKVIYKHGQGRVAGYEKRVHHDVLIPQARVQNAYSVLKQKYARKLIEGWAEATDPEKHVFEDLSIAAFLIELWAGMYDGVSFPGFVDIGCGNGLLVHILNQEGFKGWGFDARARKSWAAYNAIGPPHEDSDSGGDSLQELVLLPPPVSREGLAKLSSPDFADEMIHDGRFPKGTFIISNHADELTPWTPILAAISDCPFIMIPCCSHDLTGRRFRAPPPKDKKKADSSYASLVQWAEDIARDCGWKVEQEMLRIPSTRNTALLGRERISKDGDAPLLDIQAIVDRYGGTIGYLENVVKLAKRSVAPGSLVDSTGH